MWRILYMIMKQCYCNIVYGWFDRVPKAIVITKKLLSTNTIFNDGTRSLFRRYNNILLTFQLNAQ